MFQKFNEIIYDNENLSKGMKDFLDYHNKNRQKEKKANFYKLLKFSAFLFSILILFFLFFIAVKNTKASVDIINVPISNNMVNIPIDAPVFNSLFCQTTGSVDTKLNFNNEVYTPFLSIASFGSANLYSHIFKIDNITPNSNYSFNYQDNNYYTLDDYCFLSGGNYELIATSTNDNFTYGSSQTTGYINNINVGDLIIDFFQSNKSIASTNDNSVFLGSSWTNALGYTHFINSTYKIAENESETLSFNLSDEWVFAGKHNIFVFSKIESSPSSPIPVEHLNFFDLDYSIYHNSDLIVSSNDTFSSYSFNIGNVNTTTDDITIDITFTDRYLDYEGSVFNLYLTDKEGNFIKTYSPPSNIINLTNFPTRNISFSIPLSDLPIDTREGYILRLLVSGNRKTYYQTFLHISLWSGDIPADVLNLTYDYDLEKFDKVKSVWREKIIFSTFMTIYDGFSNMYENFSNLESISSDYKLSFYGKEVNIFDFFENTETIKNYTFKISKFVFLGFLIFYITWRVRNSLGSQDT